MIAELDDSLPESRFDIALSMLAQDLFQNNRLIGLQAPSPRTKPAVQAVPVVPPAAAAPPSAPQSPVHLRRMGRDWKLAHMIMEDWVWSFFRAVACRLPIAYQYHEPDQALYCPLTGFLNQYKDILGGWGIDYVEVSRLHVEFHEALEELAHTLNRSDTADIITFDRLMAVAVLLRRHMIDIGAQIGYRLSVSQGESVAPPEPITPPVPALRRR